MDANFWPSDPTGDSFDETGDRDNQWLQIETVPADGGTIRLSVTGDLDRLAAAQLVRAVDDAVRRSSPALVEIDAAGVGFLDSSGIRCLLICRGHAEDAGCRFRLVDPPPAVMEVLRITGLLEEFGVPEPAQDRARWRHVPARPPTPQSRRHRPGGRLAG